MFRGTPVIQRKLPELQCGTQGYRKLWAFLHAIIAAVILALFHRKSPLYDNCFLHAPDGQPLCTCDRKKAQWYLDKGIGGRHNIFLLVFEMLLFLSFLSPLSHLPNGA